MQVLESEEVRSSISNWIDLVYGKKSWGEEAIEACNIYPQLTYEEF